MTEIPEHLLKRSKQRREAMGLSGGDAGEAASTPPAAEGGESSAGSVEQQPAAGAASPPAAPPPVPAAPPPKPDPPYVTAARTRKKVPMWAAPVLAVLPLWGFIYYQSLQKPPAGANDPLVLGAQVYNVKGGCAGCHGTDGAGGVGAKLKDGDTVQTFKNPLAMVHWIAFGAADGARPNGTYGDVNRPGGPHNINTLPGQMPAFKDTLTPQELAAVTMYERQVISAGKPDKGFAPEDFPNLPDTIQKVIDAGPSGDPKLPTP